MIRSELGSHHGWPGCIDQLLPETHLPPPPQCWDWRQMPPCSDWSLCFSESFCITQADLEFGNLLLPQPTSAGITSMSHACSSLLFALLCYNYIDIDKLLETEVQSLWGCLPVCLHVGEGCAVYADQMLVAFSITFYLSPSIHLHFLLHVNVLPAYLYVHQVHAWCSWRSEDGEGALQLASIVIVNYHKCWELNPIKPLWQQ